MLSILKILTIFASLNPIKAQLTVPGSQTDEHNCVLDGGYQWCERAQACQRIWETPCEETLTNTIVAIAGGGAGGGGGGAQRRGEEGGRGGEAARAAAPPEGAVARRGYRHG